MRLSIAPSSQIPHSSVKVLEPLTAPLSRCSSRCSSISTLSEEAVSFCPNGIRFSRSPSECSDNNRCGVEADVVVSLEQGVVADPSSERFRVLSRTIEWCFDRIGRFFEGSEQVLRWSCDFVYDCYVGVYLWGLLFVLAKRRRAEEERIVFEAEMTECYLGLIRIRQEVLTRLFPPTASLINNFFEQHPDYGSLLLRQVDVEGWGKRNLVLARHLQRVIEVLESVCPFVRPNR